MMSVNGPFESIESDVLSYADENAHRFNKYNDILEQLIGDTEIFIDSLYEKLFENNSNLIYKKEFNSKINKTINDSLSSIENYIVNDIESYIQNLIDHIKHFKETYEKNIPTNDNIVSRISTQDSNFMFSGIKFNIDIIAILDNMLESHYNFLTYLDKNLVISDSEKNSLESSINNTHDNTLTLITNVENSLDLIELNSDYIELRSNINYYNGQTSNHAYSQYETTIGGDELLIYDSTKHQYLTENIFYFTYDIRNIFIKDKSQSNILDIYESINIDDSYNIYNIIGVEDTLNNNNYIMHDKRTNVINTVNKLNNLFIKNNEINITINNYNFYVLTEISLNEENFESNFTDNNRYVIKKNEIFKDYVYNDTNKEYFTGDSIYYTIGEQIDLEKLILSNNLLYFIDAKHRDDDKYVSSLSEYCEHYFNVNDKIKYSKITSTNIDHTKNFDSNNDSGTLEVTRNNNNNKTISFKSNGLSDIKPGYVVGFNFIVETKLNNIKYGDVDADNTIITVDKVNLYDRNEVRIKLDENYSNEGIINNIIQINGVKYARFYVTNVNIRETYTRFTLIKTNDPNDTTSVNLLDLDIDKGNEFIIYSELKNMYIEDDNTFSYNKTLKIIDKSEINYDSNYDFYDLSETMSGNLINNNKYMVKIPNENIYVPITSINDNIYKNINIFSDQFHLYNSDFTNKINNESIKIYDATEENNDTYNLIPNLTGDRLVTRVEFIEQTDSNYILTHETPDNIYYFNKNEYQLYNHYNLLKSRYTQITNIDDIKPGENYILHKNINDKDFIFISIVNKENNNLTYIKCNSTVKNIENEQYTLDFTTGKLSKFNDIDDFYYKEDLLIKNDNYYLVPVNKIKREKYISTNNNDNKIYLEETLYNNLFQKIFIGKRDIQNGVGNLYSVFQTKTLQNARNNIEYELHYNTFNENNELQPGVTSKDIYDKCFEKKNDTKFERLASLTIPNSTDDQYFSSITLENNILTLVVPSDNLATELEYKTNDKFNNNPIDITSFKSGENVYITETEGEESAEVITIATMIEIIKRKITGKFNNNVADNHSLGNLIIGNKVLDIIELYKNYFDEDGNLTIKLSVSIIDNNFKNKNIADKLDFLSGTTTIQAFNDIVFTFSHIEGEKWFWCIILKVIIYFIIYIVWALIGGGIAEAIKSVGSAAIDAGIDALMLQFDPAAGLANWMTPSNVSSSGVVTSTESREEKLIKLIKMISIEYAENFDSTSLDNLRATGNAITLENAKKTLESEEGQILLSKIANKCNLDLIQNRESCIHLAIAMASRESNKEIIVPNAFSQITPDEDDEPGILYTTFVENFNITETYNEKNDNDPLQLEKTTKGLIISLAIGESINLVRSETEKIYTSQTTSKRTVISNKLKTSNPLKLQINTNEPFRRGKTISTSINKLGSGIKTSLKPAVKFAGKLGLKLLDMIGIELVKGGVDWLLYGSYICSSPGALAEIVWEIRKAADSSLSGLVPRFNEKSFNSVSEPYLLFVNSNSSAPFPNNRVTYSSYNSNRNAYNNLIFYNKIDTNNNKKYYFVYNSLNYKTKMYIYFSKMGNNLRQCYIDINDNFSIKTFVFYSTNNVVLINRYNKIQEPSAKTNIFNLIDLYFETNKELSIKDYIKDNPSNHFLFEFEVIHRDDIIWANDISAKGMFTLKLSKLINLDESSSTIPNISYSNIINKSYEFKIINNNYYFMYLTSDDYSTPVITNYKFTKNDKPHNNNIYQSRNYIEMPISYFKNKDNQYITNTFLTQNQIDILINDLTPRDTNILINDQYYSNLLYTTTPNINDFNIKYYTLFTPINNEKMIIKLDGVKSKITLGPTIHEYHNVKVNQNYLFNEHYMVQVACLNYDYSTSLNSLHLYQYYRGGPLCTLFRIDNLNELQNAFMNPKVRITSNIEYEIVYKLSGFEVGEYLLPQYKSGYVLYKDKIIYLLAFTVTNISDILFINKDFFNIN